MELVFPSLLNCQLNVQFFRKLLNEKKVDVCYIGNLTAAEFNGRFATVPASLLLK